MPFCIAILVRSCFILVWYATCALQIHKKRVGRRAPQYSSRAFLPSSSRSSPVVDPTPNRPSSRLRVAVLWCASALGFARCFDTDVLRDTNDAFRKISTFLQQCILKFSSHQLSLRRPEFQDSPSTIRSPSRLRSFCRKEYGCSYRRWLEWIGSLIVHISPSSNVLSPFDDILRERILREG